MDLTSIGKKLTDATTALAKADKDLKLEMAGAAADAAGIIDPSPASDIVGAGISIARGDYWGAALSTASMVPYVGDLLAKPAKAVRATKAIAGLEKKVAALTKTVTDLKKAKKEAEAVEAAAKEVKIAREADVAKDAASKQEKSATKKEKDCEDCGATAANKIPNTSLGELATKAAATRPLNTTRSGVTRTNTADWRSLRDHWNDLGYDEILSDANLSAIAKGKTPKVDNSWVTVFPEDAGLLGEKISMHHIGSTPLTVPLAATRHLNAHMPGGFRYNAGGPGSALPFYPPKP